MPLRTAILLLVLFGLCVGIATLAWANGSEFYLFSPGKTYCVHTPPTDPIAVLIALAFCAALYLYSPHYSLIVFSSVLASVLMGTVVGRLVFSWHPTLMQHVLSVAMIVAVTYGWSEQQYLDY